MCSVSKNDRKNAGQRTATVKKRFFLEPMIRTSYKNQTLSRCFFSLLAFFLAFVIEAESIKVVRGFLTTTKEFS